MLRLLVLTWLVAVTLPAAAEDPKIAYWLHCAGCHRLDGSGAPPDVPTLIGEPGRIAALPGGREYLIRIPGVAQAGVGDAELAEVLNYVLLTFSAASLPRDFVPFEADEIGRFRGRVLEDPLKRRSELFGLPGSDTLTRGGAGPGDQLVQRALPGCR